MPQKNAVRIQDYFEELTDPRRRKATYPLFKRRPAVYHPWNFRGWYDFGTGALGDMGCHHGNTPRCALKLGHATAVSASPTKVMDESWPLASIITYEFPHRDSMPPVRIVWHDGGLMPPRPV